MSGVLIKSISLWSTDDCTTATKTAVRQLVKRTQIFVKGKDQEKDLLLKEKDEDLALKDQDKNKDSKMGLKDKDNDLTSPFYSWLTSTPQGYFQKS